LRRDLSQPLWVLFAATGVLLGLACLNVAGLFSDSRACASRRRGDGAVPARAAAASKVALARNRHSPERLRRQAETELWKSGRQSGKGLQLLGLCV
jgi:hypothetical protein